MLAWISAFAIASAARPPIVKRGERFTCTATRVWDGDGPIWCAEGPRVRLARINARELDDTCRPRAPCPATSGKSARDHLVTLLGGSRGVTANGHIRVAGARLSCRSDGWAKGNRTAAWCSIGGRDLSALMVDHGFAAAWANPHPSRGRHS